MKTFLDQIGPGILVGLVALPVLARDHSYTFYDMGFLGCPSDPYTEATDVNDTGVVSASSVVNGCIEGHAFTWFNGVKTDLDDAYEKGNFASAEAIGRTGVIMGAGLPPAYVLDMRDGVVTLHDPPAGCEQNGYPRGMNTAGTIIAGRCSDGGSIFSPAVYWIEDGTALALDLLPGLPDDATGEARDVNDAGVVIAQIDGEARAYTWIDGVITEIPNLVGGTGIGVAGINNHNLIVGEVVGVGAMSYDLNSGEMTILGSGRADGVNDRGSAVGRDILDFSAVHAILYEGGDAIDLSPFFPPVLADDARARAINNYGWIVGWGDDDTGSAHGWLLVPIYDKGDYDGDGDLDHQDFQHFQRCFAAEPYIDGTLHVGCSVFDFDDDVDLDLDDYAAFQSAFTGPTAPNLNPNGPG